MTSEEKSEQNVLNVLGPDLEVVFDVQVYGRAQDEKRKLLRQKNAVSPRRKESLSDPGLESPLQQEPQCFCFCGRLAAL